MCFLETTFLRFGLGHSMHGVAHHPPSTPRQEHLSSEHQDYS